MFYSHFVPEISGVKSLAYAYMYVKSHKTIENATVDKDERQQFRPLSLGMVPITSFRQFQRVNKYKLQGAVCMCALLY